MYGFETDEVKVSSLHFGGNFGKTFMTKFEFNPNGGKDGAAQDCLDITFNINGTEKSYRKFPIVEAYAENNEKTTDRTHPKFLEEVKNLNSVIIHILKAFNNETVIKAALQTKIESFKDFVNICKNLLPEKFAEKPLDIFLQWQWTLSTSANSTFLEIPSKMKHGYFLCPAQQAKGEWKEVRDGDGLRYLDSEDVEHKHPFVRNSWFMDSNHGTQQRQGSALDNSGSSTNSGSGSSVSGSGW